ncbi:MAG: heme-binding domain-containing protein [Flavobacteriaceae bacterium]|nr:heme-binding domain-containing protein [Flavobacteriaceae bacterium]
MKVLKIIAIILLLTFVGIQFIPTTRNQSDIVLSTDLMETYNVPEQVEVIFKTSCYDCHSNNTIYPWYNKIQPVSLIMESHIKEAKAELNFNEFGSYSERKQKSKFKSILSQVKDGEMPLASYTLMHREAKLSENEKKALENWINKMLESL